MLLLQVLFSIILLLFCMSLYFLWRNKKVADFRLYLIHLVFLNNVLEKRMFDFNEMFPSYDRMLYTPRSLNYWLKTCGKDLRLNFNVDEVQKSAFSKHSWLSIQQSLDYITKVQKNEKR